jgi:tRNA(fMet)-specific endonuclease VapC
LAVLIDTSVLVDRERRGALENVVGNEEAAISVITVSELLQGVERATGAHRVRRRAVVEHILAAFDPVPITEPIARVHSLIWADLASRGQIIGAHDLWIAATAIGHGFGLATLNRTEFERVPGLRLMTV